MADEKAAVSREADASASPNPSTHDNATAEAGTVQTELTGWRYKSLRLGPIKIPYYASPQTQLVMVAFVCFMCPGMFNALSGLGGGGQVSATAADNGNVALYSTFSVVGFCAGSIANVIGLRWTLSFGGFGYFIYICAFLSYNHNQNAGFIIFAGALLGVCAGLLWAAQGTIMMSYPPERSKGRYISAFWAIFNLGGVIGGLVSSRHIKQGPTQANVCNRSLSAKTSTTPMIHQ